MQYKIKELADLAGISVRMLHHYDKIGLLKPGSVNAAGYRFYTTQELEKLQQVLFFKELAFSLAEIKEIMNNKHYDKKHTLKNHKELLIKKKQRLEKIIAAVDETIRSLEGGVPMDTDKIFSAFDMAEIEKHQARYADEVKAKYGNSAAYRESRKKTARYTKADWQAVFEKSSSIFKKAAALSGKAPADPALQEVVAEWRAHITESFYNCTPEIFRGLGGLYVTDARFTANIDSIKPGLAQLLKAAIDVYCDNLEKK